MQHVPRFRLTTSASLAQTTLLNVVEDITYNSKQSCFLSYLLRVRGRSILVAILLRNWSYLKVETCYFTRKLLFNFVACLGFRVRDCQNCGDVLTSNRGPRMQRAIEGTAWLSVKTNLTHPSNQIKKKSWLYKYR